MYTVNGHKLQVVGSCFFSCDTVCKFCWQVLALQPPAATELRPPNRELGAANTGEILRKFRKEEMLGAETTASC